MAQRNPMNERYQGDGPQGKTRKSAAKLKPKTEAASSVYIETKPTTRSERKAARKKREKQLAAKEAERRRKAEEREKAARREAGEEAEEPEKTSVGQKVKNIFLAGPKDPKASPARLRGPDTPEYRKLKKAYWILMGVGIAAIIASFAINFLAPTFLDGWGMMVPMGIAYATVISAIVLDYAKIRKLQKKHAQLASGAKMSPKQLKHEQKKAEAAALLEESKRAQRELKRANSRLPFKRKDKETAQGDISKETQEAQSSKSKETKEEL